jgi:cell filamentation protein, protein adenylyltransferase
VNGAVAFVPQSLPPLLSLDMAFARLLSEADAALSELSGLGRQLPNPHLLIAPYLKREAVLSSRIEGTQASLNDLFREELASPEDDTSDVKEVSNYARALELGIQRLQTLPLSLRLVREIHGALLAEVRGQDQQPGEFRRHQNFIGPRGSTLATAIFVPPPVTEMNAALDSWEKFLHSDHSLPDLVACALMHAQFETIHPFGDGNGRVGRLLITLFLVSRNRLSQPLLYLSAFIEEHKNDYYDLLQRTRTHGDWRQWLDFFLTGVREIAKESTRQVTQLLDVRESWRANLRGHANEQALVDALLANPFITVDRAARVMNKSFPTASAAIDWMTANGYLAEITGRKRGRVFAAEAILAIIERDSRDPAPLREP